MKVEDSICDAIEIIVNKKLAEAGFNKTITAIINEQIDVDQGKYKIAYQDTFFEAYAIDPDIVYSPGTSVYILLLNNNMDSKKIILSNTLRKI